MSLYVLIWVTVGVNKHRYRFVTVLAGVDAADGRRALVAGRAEDEGISDAVADGTTWDQASHLTNWVQHYLILLVPYLGCK